MNLKAVMTFEFPSLPDWGTPLSQAGIDFAYRPSKTEDEIIAALQDADVLVSVTAVQAITRLVMENSPRLRFIMSMGIGYEGVDVDAATDLGILVANVPDYCLEEVSDHAMALLLACSRQVVRLDNAARSGKWMPEGQSPEIMAKVWPLISRLSGKTLGLVGFGRIPRTLVPKAKGFGIRIIAYDPYVPESVARELGVELVGLEQLLKESDFVSLHAALTTTSRHLIGLEQLRMMRPSAYLINTSRGPVIDEQALSTALKEGIIAGAAVDVTDPEPPSADSPLYAMDNLIITAHTAHYSPQAFAEAFARPVHEVIRVAKGEWPVGLVNPHVKEKYQQRWIK
ncbi:C-terminal binding protein [Chloroflexota bacterium]